MIFFIIIIVCGLIILTAIRIEFIGFHNLSLM